MSLPEQNGGSPETNQSGGRQRDIDDLADQRWGSSSVDDKDIGVDSESDHVLPRRRDNSIPGRCRMKEKAQEEKDPAIGESSLQSLWISPGDDYGNGMTLRPNLRSCLRTHRIAVLWSLAISASIVMEAYDASLISGFFALPAFAQRFGNQLEDGRWNVG